MSEPLGSLPEELRDYVGAESCVSSLAFLAQHPSLLRDLGSGRPDPVDETGATFGAYRLLRLISNGGCASVYEATNDQGDHVALKVSWPGDRDGAALLRREFGVVHGMQHPAVVHAIDLLIYGDRVGLVFELLPGLSLAHALHDEVAVTTSLVWFRHLADALSHVHGCGVVHRDVKPGNLVIGSNGAPKLIDFGLAADSDGVVGIRELAGTLPYMSPEQALGGLAAVGPRSDIYSLAVTFHELLTGRRVAEQAGRSHVLESVAFESVVPPSKLRSGLPRVLDAVFECALHKDPSRRYHSAAELRDDLDAVIRGAPLPHASVPALVRATRWLLRHRMLTLVASAAIALVSVMTVAGALGRAERRELAMQQLRASISRGPDYDDLLKCFTEASNAGCEPAALRAFLFDQGSDIARAGTQQILSSTGMLVGRATDGVVALRAASLRAYETTGHHEFLLQTAWLALRMGDVSGAQRLLDREDAHGIRDGLYFELSALVAAELADQQLLSLAEARLGGPDQIARMTNAELVVRALRLVHRVRVARQSAEMALDRTVQQEMLDEAAHRTAGLARDGGVLAATVAAQAMLLQGHTRRAMERFDELARTVTDRGERSALRLHAVLARSVLQEMESQDWAFARDQPGAAWWLMRYAFVLGHKAAVADWASRVDVVEVPSAEREQLCAAALAGMLAVVASGDTATCASCVDAVGVWSTDGWGRERQAEHADLLLVACSVADRYCEALEQRGSPEEAESWRVRAIQLANTAIGRGYPRSAEFRAIRARATAAGK